MADRPAVAGRERPARVGRRHARLRLRPRGRVAICECRHWNHVPLLHPVDHRRASRLFVAAVCLGTAFLVGLLPAVQASRLAANRSLKEGEKTATSGVGRRRLTTVLLTVELALTLVLLAGAGLMMRSFLAVYRADSIVDAARVLTMPVVSVQREVRHARAAH